MLRNRIFIFFVIAAIGAGCSVVKAPSGYVPKRKQLHEDAFGAWTILLFNNGERRVEGELISVSSDSIHLMYSGQLTAYSKGTISQARVIYFNTDADAFAGLSFLLGLGTLANGYFLIFTLPVTIVVGASTASAEAKRQNYFEYPATSWNDLTKFSRFPQGLPSGLSPDAFKPRRRASK